MIPPNVPAKTVNIGIIGCGYWGPNHLRTFNSLPDSRVVAVADVDPSRQQRMQRLSPDVECFNDHRQLLAAEKVDAVVVVTPTGTHHEVVKDALMAGKHVLCEKPLCRRACESEELVALSQKQHRVLMVGHVFLFNPGIIKLKQLLDAGELGAPMHMFAIRTNLGPVRSDVNVAYDLASHDIAIFNWLMGGVPEQVSAMGACFLQPGVEDVMTISMKYPGNILAGVQVSWLDPKKIRQITLVGSKKMATWNDLDLGTPVAVYEKGVEKIQDISSYGEFLRLSMFEGDIHLPRVRSEEPLKLQAQHFIRQVRGEGSALADGRFGLGVVRVLESIEDNLRKFDCCHNVT